MFKRIIPPLILLSFINTQIALPTFQGVHTPHSTSSSSSETLTFNGGTGNLTGHTFTENNIGWTTNNAGIYTAYNSIAPQLDGYFLLNFNSRVGEIGRTDGAEFTFVSITVQGDSRYGSNTDVQFRAYKNGVMVQDETRNLSNSEWVTQTFNWSDIDKFTWDPINPTTCNVALDNLIYIP